MCARGHDSPPGPPSGWLSESRLVADRLEPRLGFARRIAREAGQILMDFYRNGVRAERKGEVDFVTQADHESERYLASELRRTFPGDAVVAEEGGGEPEMQALCWFLDPLDGTTNFLHGVPIFAVSIGLSWQGRPVAGVVHHPPLGETFSAVHGRGAFLDQRRLSVSATGELADSLLATGFPYDRRQRPGELLTRWRRAMMQAHGVRRCGAAAIDLCWVAAGRYDGFFEEGLAPWDTCAGAAILAEAGGRLSDGAGGPFDLFGHTVVASNGRIHEALLERVVQPETAASP